MNVAAVIQSADIMCPRLSPCSPFHDRGFGHASVLKTFVVDLKDVAGKGSGPATVAQLRFCNVPPSNASLGKGVNSKVGNGEAKIHDNLGWDGLPQPGTWVEPGDPLYCIVDELTGKVTAGKVKVGSLRASWPMGLLHTPFWMF